jgi:hypothetical protein
MLMICFKNVWLVSVDSLSDERLDVFVEPWLVPAADRVQLLLVANLHKKDFRF